MYQCINESLLRLLHVILTRKRTNRRIPCTLHSSQHTPLIRPWRWQEHSRWPRLCASSDSTYPYSIPPPERSSRRRVTRLKLCSIVALSPNPGARFYCRSCGAATTAGLWASSLVTSLSNIGHSFGTVVDKSCLSPRRRRSEKGSGTSGTR